MSDAENEIAEKALALALGQQQGEENDENEGGHGTEEDGEHSESSEEGQDKEKEKDHPDICIVSHHYMPGAIWMDTKEGGRWIGLPGMPIKAATKKIKDMLKVTDPTNFIIMVYQAYVGNTDLTTIEGEITEIIQAVNRTKRHRLIISNLYFVPAEELCWEKVQQLNSHIRLLNLDMGGVPLNLQKSLLTRSSNGKVQYIEPRFFSEYCNRIGVGENLSYEGLEKVKECIVKYIEGGAFLDIDRPASKAVAPDFVPPPLCYHNSYKGDETMMYYIKEKGLKTPRNHSLQRESQQGGASNRSSSAKRPDNPSKKPQEPGFRGRVKTNEAAKRVLKFGEQEKVQSEQMEWDSDDDLTPEEVLTRNYLAAKKKLEKKQAGPTIEEVKIQLKQMRIQGIQASKKAREKYEEFEKTIAGLKEEVQDKAKKLRKTEEKGRKLDEKDRKIREKDKKIDKLEEELDETYDTIKKLRKDLADVDNDLEEWKDAYENVVDKRSGKKKRKNNRDSS